MKRLLGVAAASTLLAAVPAWADKPPHPTHPTHPAHGVGHMKTHTKGTHGKACTARDKGYDAKGTLVSATLTATGQKDRYDGTITVDITRANHKAPTGSQTFTLTSARVRFGKGVDASSVAAGDRVALHGKMAALPHKCDSTGFTSTTVVRHLRIRAPRK